MSKLHSLPYAGKAYGSENRNTDRRQMLQLAAEFHLAISRRKDECRADEIILRLNLSRGTTFTFLSLKALTGAYFPTSNSQFSASTKGTCTR